MTDTLTGGEATASAAAPTGLSRVQREALRSLLLAALAGHRDDRATLERLVREAPVGAVPSAANLHRVTGSVRRSLDGVAGVPDDVVRELEAVRQAATVQHLLIVGVLAQIRTAFDGAGLSWLVMKGPVAAARLYPDIGDRRYGDLDLLVAPAEFGQAMELLERLGFRHVIRNWSLAERMLAGQVEMRRAGISVDLHWHLHYSRQDRRPYRLDPDELLARARRVAVSGVEVPTFDAVDTLMTLAFHAARSDGHRLLWLKDVERAVSVEEPDYDELVLRCRDARCSAPVGIILGRTHELLGASIPLDTLRALTSPSLRAAERVVCRVVHPVQFDERSTVTRVFTRSVRSTGWLSLTALPSRSFGRVHRLLLPPRENETDDPDEKASFLRAVAATAAR